MHKARIPHLESRTHTVEYVIEGFKLAESQLREIAGASEGSISIDNVETGDTLLVVGVSVRFSALAKTDDGLQVRARESFYVYVAPSFPFYHPYVEVKHDRFAGFDHVQWRRHLCLYRSSAEWSPEDGMYGFVRRLDAWIRDAAINNLDPIDAPLHPPVAYPTVNRLIVPRANTPSVTDKSWIGIAELQQRQHRFEITDWLDLSESLPECFAPSILLADKFPFEYPDSVGLLLRELEAQRVDRDFFLRLLAIFALSTAPNVPLLVILGTPMRRPDPNGPNLQHLVAWQISDTATKELRDLGCKLMLGKRSIEESEKQTLKSWSENAKVDWCEIQEMRPEVIRRRDSTSNMSWFSGKSVAIWGCGAIGSHVAEFVTRAGASVVQLVDNKKVTPGVLVRQGFEDADIGKSKVSALHERLQRICPSLNTTLYANDLIEQLVNTDALPTVDLIIDCTASRAVRTALERQVHLLGSSRPPIACLALNSLADSAMVTLSKPSHSGCTLDLIRRLKLEACRDSTLKPVFEAFWLETDSIHGFQPEPGCSEPTFVGSQVDIAGLSARMLNCVAQEMLADTKDTGLGWFIRESDAVRRFAWVRDQTIEDVDNNFTIRVCENAKREIFGWRNRSIRLSGASVETGGLVFGEINEAARVIWVSEVDGPPPDSSASKEHFTCGILGTDQASKKRRERFHGSVDCIGNWHTHPHSQPLPSRTDLHAVEMYLSEQGQRNRSCLQLILSGNPSHPVLGAHLFRRKLGNKPVIQASATHNLDSKNLKPKNIGLALSGGGFRAIAFHLGCLRALNDLNLLGRVQVISSVSGGSVIAAMYAYSTDSFSDFDKRVVSLLQRGIQADLITRMLSPRAMLKWFSARVTRRNMRDYGRTEILRDFLAENLFDNRLVRDVARDSLEIVINATELQTGTAFRFGSQESGNWRLGTMADEEALVADAVAASAAYPLLLPALKRKYHFTKNEQSVGSTRVLLADGGIYENLGVSPMLPGRESSISTNVFTPDYIVCCDAGTGTLEDYPPSWMGGVRRSIATVFKKTQDAMRNRLHTIALDQQISGFVLCFLGQHDESLPWVPGGLPTRQEVNHFKTDFASLKHEDINRLTLRGELLMRYLCAFYLNEV